MVGRSPLGGGVRGGLRALAVAFAFLVAVGRVEVALVARSWTTRIAWSLAANLMKSASQWPGVWRFSASPGRSPIGRRSFMRSAGDPPFLPRQPRFDLARGR